MKTIFDMTKEDFNKVPKRDNRWSDFGEFRSLVIIPMDYEHDSGWMCMDFVAVNDEGEPICRLSGCSDVLTFNVIGGCGKRWSIDCLPCGYLRLFSQSALTAGPELSIFEIYAK